MNKITSHIADFIARHHVVSIACNHNGTIWAASCFYTFDPAKNRLIILTSPSTRHGKLMLENPHIAGTISAQPENIWDIEGIQFSATARYLEAENEKQVALNLYYHRHPLAKLMPNNNVWEICFDEIKHTENRITFAHKTYWKRKVE